jgi:hypothetical protein
MMELQTRNIDKEKAIGIAKRFLEQYFSVKEIDAALFSNVWIVTALFEVYSNVMMEQIRIDSSTGKIEEYTLANVAPRRR